MKDNIMFFKYLTTFYAIYTTFTPLQDRNIYIGILTYNTYVHNNIIWFMRDNFVKN